MQVKYNPTDKTFNITGLSANVENPPASASGKTVVLASTRGNQTFNVDIGGGKSIPVTIGINAYMPKPQ